MQFSFIGGIFLTAIAPVRSASMKPTMAARPLRVSGKKGEPLLDAGDDDGWAPGHWSASGADRSKRREGEVWTGGAGGDGEG